MFEATEEEMFKGTSEEFPAIFGVTKPGIVRKKHDPFLTLNKWISFIN